MEDKKIRIQQKIEKAKVKKPKRLSVLDIYFNHWFLFDLILTLLIAFFALKIFSYNYFNIKPVTDFSSLNTELISTTIGLAGFIFTALTIIVTFSENIAAKKHNEGSSIEYLMTSSFYDQIVHIFLSSCVIYIFEFSLLSTINIFWNHFNVFILFVIHISIISISVFAFLRCIYLIYSIISLQSKRNKKVLKRNSN